MPKPTLITLLLVGLIAGCTPNTRQDIPAETTGYVPIYASASVAKTITAGPPRPTVNAGKLYTVGNLLFQVEADSGIHVINYTDPEHPQKLGFIRSVLCKELSVKNGFIYTNNLSDLVVIDINDMNNIHEVNRVASVFPDLALQYPAKPQGPYKIYFECPDPEKGIVIGWEQKTIKNAKCWR